jgi:hypothetical protein
MKYLLINILIILLIVVGVFSTIRMNISWLLAETTLWFIFHIFCLKKEWKYFYKLIKKILIVYFFILYLLCIIVLISQSQALATLVKILNIGIITMLFLIPVVTDSFLIVTRKIPYINYFFEAFILIRNFISGLVDDLMLGILTAPKYRNSNLISKGKFVILASYTLLARTPDIITNLLISTKLVRFDTILLKKTTKFSLFFFMSIIACFIFFLIHIIIYYDHL